MTRTHPQITLAVLALALLSAAACVNFNKPSGWAGPTLADDLLVVSTDKGELSALSIDDFTPLWTFPTGQEDPQLDLKAIYTTPPIVNDTVYLGSYGEEVYALHVTPGESGDQCGNSVDDDADGQVNEGCPRAGNLSERGEQCANDSNDDTTKDGADDDSVNDGCPVWRWRFAVDGPIIAGLAASESTIYAATDNGTLYALNAEDGAQVASFDAGDGIWGTPLLDAGVIYVASVSGKLYALDAETLVPIWDAPFETESGLISDLVAADGLVLVGGIGRKLHAVAADSGQERWSFSANNWFWGRPLVVNDTVYAPNLDGRLFALSLETGEERWSFEAEDPDPFRSAPVLAGGLLVVVDRGGNVYGIEPTDGSLVWSKVLAATVLSDPLVLTPTTGAAEEVFISAQGGDLFRLEDTATGKVTRLDLATGTFIEVVTQ